VKSFTVFKYSWKEGQLLKRGTIVIIIWLNNWSNNLYNTYYTISMKGVETLMLSFSKFYHHKLQFTLRSHNRVLMLESYLACQALVWKCCLDENAFSEIPSPVLTSLTACFNWTSSLTKIMYCSKRYHSFLRQIQNVNKSNVEERVS